MLATPEFNAVQVIPSALEYMAPPAPTATNTVPQVTPRKSLAPSGAAAVQGAGRVAVAVPASRGTADTEGLPGPPGPPLTRPLTVNE